jgi:polyphosphate kinase
MAKKARARFFNRELSWIEFNARVLAEGLQKKNPLLERLKFLSIVSSNFDEFFMVRVASVKKQIAKRRPGNCPSGLSPLEQMQRIDRRVRELVRIQYQCLLNDIIPSLAQEGIELVRPADYSEAREVSTQSFFEREILPVMTPVRIEKGESLHGTGNLQLHVAFLLEGGAKDNPLRTTDSAEDGLLTAVVRIPEGIDRLVWVSEAGGNSAFSLVEDIVVRYAPLLFPGCNIKEYLIFRVTRDADLSVDESLDEDLLTAMGDVLIDRRHSTPVRLEISGSSTLLKSFLMRALNIDSKDIYENPGPLDLKGLMGLCFIPGFDELRYVPWPSYPSPRIQAGDTIWDALRREDILLHHPYESFDPVIRLVSEAAADPNVMAIKMTLYRTSGDSPIIKALAKAAENGKQVTVFVELKARFDEKRNIGWVQHLEKLGVIVIYGITGFKVHAKVLLVVRQESDGMKSYLHLGTGNYNDTTAKLYTDLGLMTSKNEIAFEAAQFFNAISGYSDPPDLRKLAMAPVAMKVRILAMIQREANRSGPDNPGLIMGKTNSLSDADVINALYKASAAGVKILLNVRGVCMLRPGMKGRSDKITVVSIVDRFLEHSRIFYFQNGGNEEIYLSSADWMPRNLERRVELMFPIEQNDLRARVKGILETFFRDNQNAHVLKRDGSYVRLSPSKGSKRRRSQQIFYQEARRRSRTRVLPVSETFTVRRTPPQSAPL